MPTRIRTSLLWIACLAASAGATPSQAAPAWGGGRGATRPALVSPAPGERLAESAVRFAFEIPTGWNAEALLVSRRPFDPTSWTEIPVRPDLVIASAKEPVVSLAETGISIDAATPLWWAVAARDPGTRRLSVSEVRSFMALPRFANRVAQTPLLPPARRGTMNWAERLASLVGSTTPSVPGSAPRIRLAAGFDFDPAEGAPRLPLDLAATRALGDGVQGNGLHAFLVQYARPPGPEQVAAITRAGGSIVSYIPDRAYLVRMSDESKSKLGAEANAPRWIGNFEPAFKLSPLVQREAAGDTLFEALLFPDADLGLERGEITRQGHSVVGAWDNGINKLIRFRAPAGALPTLAARSGVAWIEPVVPVELDNNLAQWVTQTNQSENRRVWTMGIRGQGQVVTTSDSGIETTHDQFRDPAVPLNDFGDYPTHRKIIGYKKGSLNAAVTFGDYASTYHGTHTAGTIAGSDDPTTNLDLRDGMAKEAKIYFMDIGGPTISNFVDPFPDLNDLFGPPYAGNAGGAARISSNSWGSPVNGTYTLFAYEVDQFVWTHPDFFVSFSNGNSNPNTPAPTGGLVGSPASAKNCVGMGGTQNGTLAANIYNRTSRGPTADGRRKPTICSPGQSVSSAFGNNTYASLSGTSMASPSGSGAVTLLRQYLTDGWYPTGAPVPANGFSPTAALLRAMAINSADMSLTGFTAPDTNIGYGRIDDDNVLYFPGDTRKLLVVDNTEGLGDGQFLDYPVYVTSGTVPLKVSLCWTDYPGNPAAAVQLVNNLDLTVSQGGTSYKGNVFMAGASITGGSYDNRNVEEEVLVPSPGPGLWTIRVAAPSVPVGAQGFGLCITGDVGSGAAALALDRAQYGSASPLEIQVVDGNAGATVDVSVTSSTETTPETVTLSGAGGVYSGTLALTPFTSATDDGSLTVSNGDVITATYVDGSPAATLTTQAHVEFDTPAITAVQASSQGAAGTRVTWVTDRNATSRVYYGLTPALELGSVDGVGATLSHQVWLPAQSPGTTVYYDVESVSLSGSSARDNLGGAHYRFTARGPGSVLLVYGEYPFARSFAWEDALAANGLDFDVWSGPLAANPALGDRTSGLRSYSAVLWQVGHEQAPSVTDTQRAVLDQYLSGGGRLAIAGHDLAWTIGNPTSPVYTPERNAWLNNTLHASFVSDLATFTQAVGVLGDSISGPNTVGVSYSPIWPGGAGDEISLVPGNGQGAFIWRTNDVTPKNIGLRWEGSSAAGNPSSALWGGLPSRLVDLFFEFGALAPPFDASSATRNGILGRTVAWLLGRDRPTAHMTSPNGGESFSTSSVSIQWTESVGAGRTVASRALEYSLDGGASWSPLASPGPSPYSWDVSAIPNAADVRVRVRVTDDGSPALSASDASDAGFALARAGADARGPLVVAGSIAVSPNPLVRGTAGTLEARISERNTGGAAVSAAEWSFGIDAEPAGSGTAMSGAFGTVEVDVTAGLDTNPFLTGNRKLWVRGRDAAGNWGPATAFDVVVNGTPLLGAEDIPRVVHLDPVAPNPFVASTSIRFGLPAPSRVELGIYDVRGRLVRWLVRGAVPAGEHLASWDGKSEAGTPAPAGLYYCRLSTPAARLEKRLARL